MESFSGQASAASQLQKATMAIIAQKMISSKERNRLGQIFKRFDTDKNGNLSFDELKGALE